MSIQIHSYGKSKLHIIIDAEPANPISRIIECALAGTFVGGVLVVLIAFLHH